jgi:hypothetical protein
MKKVEYDVQADAARFLALAKIAVAITKRKPSASQRDAIARLQAIQGATSIDEFRRQCDKALAKK